MAPSLKEIAQKTKAKKSAAVPQKAAKSKSIVPNFKSAEFVQSSDEEEDEKSDEESDSDEEPAPAKPGASKPKTNDNDTLPASTESSDSSESESGSASDDSSSSEEEEEEATKAVTKKAAIPTDQSSASARTLQEPAPRTAPPKSSNCKPPHGFEIASLDGSSQVTTMFKKSSLEGKQIWYFTAPASVPISETKQMSMRDVKEGKSVLEFEGSDYGFSHDLIEDSSHTKVMVPDSSGAGFRIVKKKVDQIFHLKQLVKLPGLDQTDTGVTGFQATIPTKRPPREQPKGLKMRFRPLGFGHGKTGRIGSNSSSAEEDSDDLDALVKFRQPVSIEDENPTAKPSTSSDDNSSDSDEEMAEAPPPPILQTRVPVPLAGQIKRAKARASKKDTSNSDESSSALQDRINKAKAERAAQKKQSASQGTKRKLERKHHEGEEKSKTSSSKLASTTDDRTLKPPKEKQTESLKSKEGPLVSTEGYKSSLPIPSSTVGTNSTLAASSTSTTKQDHITTTTEALNSSQSSVLKKRKHGPSKDGKVRAANDKEGRPHKIKKVKHEADNV